MERPTGRTTLQSRQVDAILGVLLCCGFEFWKEVLLANCWEYALGWRLGKRSCIGNGIEGEGCSFEAVKLLSEVKSNETERSGSSSFGFMGDYNCWG